MTPSKLKLEHASVYGCAGQGGFHSDWRGLELESPRVPTVGLQPHLMDHYLERGGAAEAAASAGGTEPWLLGGLGGLFQPPDITTQPHSPSPWEDPGGPWYPLAAFGPLPRCSPLPVDWAL